MRTHGAYMQPSKQQEQSCTCIGDAWVPEMHAKTALHGRSDERMQATILPKKLTVMSCVCELCRGLCLKACTRSGMGKSALEILFLCDRHAEEQECRGSQNRERSREAHRGVLLREECHTPVPKCANNLTSKNEIKEVAPSRARRGTRTCGYPCEGLVGLVDLSPQFVSNFLPSLLATEKTAGPGYATAHTH